MANYQQTGIVTAPDTLKGVADLIGEGCSTIGVCMSDNVNKWAIYKPIRNSQIGILSLDTIKAQHCGLEAVMMPNLCTLLGASHPDASSYVMEGHEWNYLKPTGGVESPCRLSDFVSKDYVENNVTVDVAGYNHNAIPPDNGWNDMIITNSTLNELVNATVSISGDAYNFILSARSQSGAGAFGYVYSNFTMRFGVSTYLGGLNSNAMPFNYIAGSQGTKIWRMGLALKVWNSANRMWQYHLFISKSPLDADNAQVNAMCPDFVTNTYALLMMKEYLSTKQEYEMIPVVCENVGIQTGLSYNGYTGLACPFLDATSKIYCMPSGKVSVKLTLSENASGISSTDFEAVAVASGQYAHIGSTNVPINNLVLRYKGSSKLKQKVQITYEITYTIGTDSTSKSENTISGTYIFAKDTERGTTSESLMGGLALAVKSYNIII